MKDRASLEEAGDFAEHEASISEQPVLTRVQCLLQSAHG